MKFSIRFTVEEAAVGPVLAALNSHDGVVFDHLAIEPLMVPKPIPVPKDQTHRERRAALAAHGKRPCKDSLVNPSWFKPENPTGLTGRQIVLDLLADGQNKPTSDIKAMLVAKGFKGGGVGSLLAKMEVKGELTRVMDGVWAIRKLGG